MSRSGTCTLDAATWPCRLVVSEGCHLCACGWQVLCSCRMLSPWSSCIRCEWALLCAFLHGYKKVTARQVCWRSHSPDSSQATAAAADYKEKETSCAHQRQVLLSESSFGPLCPAHIRRLSHSGRAALVFGIL